MAEELLTRAALVGGGRLALELGKRLYSNIKENKKVKKEEFIAECQSHFGEALDNYVTEDSLKEAGDSSDSCSPIYPRIYPPRPK